MAKIIDGLVVKGQSYDFAVTDANLADIEPDPGAASKAYAVGEHLIMDGQYYKVIAPIAKNDGLEEGTNIDVDTVGNEIQALSNQTDQLADDLSVFSFRNNEGQAQYSMDNGDTWQDFKHPVGTKSIIANGEYDVTDYASANVNVGATSFQAWGRDSAMSSETISSTTLQKGNYIAFAWNAFAGVDYAYTNREISISLANGTGNSLTQWQLSHTAEKGVTTRSCIVKITNPTTLRFGYWNQNNAYKEAMIGFHIIKID